MNAPTNIITIKKILEKRALLRSNKYTVNIVPHPGSQLQVAMQNFNELELMASSITVPNENFTFATTSVGGGVNWNSPSGVNYGDLGITFYNTGFEYSVLKGIMDYIFDPITNTFRYRNECLVEIEITEFNDTNSPVGTFAFFDCLLQGIDTKSLAHASGENIESITSTWSIRNFIYRGVQGIGNSFNNMRVG